MSNGINTETIARLADDYARRIVASPECDLDLVLRKLIVEAMEIGSNSAFERICKKLGVPTEQA